MSDKKVSEYLFPGFTKFIEKEYERHIKETNGLPRNIFENGQLEKDIEKCVKEMGMPCFNDQQIKKIKDFLERQFITTTQSRAEFIDDKTHSPWLQKSKDNGEFRDFYWDALREYLRDDVGFSAQVIENINKDTDEILNRCGNPSEKSFTRRGMVIGHVQSGKTTNYNALICKAADAGY